MPQPLPSTITGTTFTANSAATNGGAIFSFGVWQLNITQSVFERNSVATEDVLNELANAGASNAAADVLHPTQTMSAYISCPELNPLFLSHIVA